jgi:hypothetical protein
MVTMTITEYWNCNGIPRGEIKSRSVHDSSGYESVTGAVKELSRRFAPKLVHKGANEVVFSEPLYVQVVRFS